MFTFAKESKAPTQRKVTPDYPVASVNATSYDALGILKTLEFLMFWLGFVKKAGSTGNASTG